MGVRIDKWLWAVRLFKTRSLATEACKSGKASINGKAIKPSKEVNIGDIVEVKKDIVLMKVKVLGLSEKRMGAALVANFMEDLTPQEEYDKRTIIKSSQFEYRDRGVGRPTKRDRRYLKNFKDID
jgi:ribosome-associated heat shock protein Hsp15